MLADVLERWLRGRKRTYSEKEAPGAEATAGPCCIDENGIEPEPRCIWDREILIERLLGDEEMAREIVEGFLEDIPQQMKLLTDSLRKGDAAAVRDRAHSIKGAAASIQAESMRSAAFEVEKAGAAGDVDAMRSHFAEMEHAFDLVKKAMASGREHSEDTDSGRRSDIA